MDTTKAKAGNLYRSVRLASLGNHRRGKHHDLIGGIIRELKGLDGNRALEIPLSNVAGVELANLRSAVHRAATAENLAIETQSDETNFYVWISEKI